jgi:DNA repair exonuclease SbcCD ATPase subunit
MADRSVNILINYKVNSVEVERYDTLAKKADQTTEKLRGSVQSFTSSAVAGFKSTGTSIAAMQNDLARLKTQIEITSKSDTKRLQELSAQYKALNTQIRAQTKEYLEQSKAIKQNATSAKELAGRFGDVFTAVKAFIAAGVAREVISISLNMAKLSGNVEGVEKAFNRLPNSTLLIHQLQEATQGTVTDLELMQKTLMANNYRIPLQNLGTLMEFAAAKAQQTGQEVNHLVDYIVTGIGLRSIKRLDDLGFTANRVKEALGGVSLQSASMGDVMSAVTKLMNEDLQKTGGLATTAATSVGQLETAWHELNVEVSKQGTNSSFINFLKQAVDSMRIFIKAGGDFTKVPLVVALEEVNKLALEQASAFQKVNEQLEERDRLLATEKELFELAQTLKSYKDIQKTGEERIDQLKTEIEQLTERNKSVIGLQKLTTEEAKAIKQKESEIASIIKNNEALISNKAVLAEVISLLVDYRESIANAVPFEAEILGLITAKRKEIDSLNESLDDATSEEKIIKIRFDIDTAKAELNELLNGDPVKNKETGKTELRIFPEELLKKPKQEDFHKYRDDLIKELQASIDALKGKDIVLLPITPYTPMTEWEKFLETFEGRKKELAGTALDLTNDLIQSEIEREVDAYNQRIDAARNFYSEQIALAGDNDRAKKEIRLKEDREIRRLEKERDDREKKSALAGILVNTAIGIAKAFATSATIYDAYLNAAIVAAEGAVQYGIANRARYYAKGAIDIPGPGTKTSDSIPAMLSRGESVMTADETSSSKNVLKAIRAKKLNDKVLKDILSGKSGGSASQIFDDSKIIKKLDELQNSQPDLVARSNMVYEQRKKGDSYVQTIRSKSMRS